MPVGLVREVERAGQRLHDAEDGDGKPFAKLWPEGPHDKVPPPGIPRGFPPIAPPRLPPAIARDTPQRYESLQYLTQML